MSITSNIADWISILLTERTGLPFKLTIKHGITRLSIPGTVAHIDFPVFDFFYSATHPAFNCTQWDCEAEGWASILESPLPAPGLSSLPSPLVSFSQEAALFLYDLPGLIYWALTRIEEINPIALDNHGRFPATASHAHKFGYLERPIIDEWIEVLRQVVSKLWPEVLLKQNHFRMLLTHDVDFPSSCGFRPWLPFARDIAGHVLKRQNLRLALQNIKIRFSTRSTLSRYDPVNTFDWIMNLSENSSLQSEFFFICGRTSAVFDSDYEPEHPAVRSLMRAIHGRGHLIGLHPSYDTCEHPERIAKEADRLRSCLKHLGIKQDAIGSRMHYLRWRHPTTLQALDRSGFAYDSTLSYADRPGFRCGTCFEYPAFDPTLDRALAIRIRPLIAMDVTVMATRYLGLGTGEEAFQKLATLKTICKKMGGTFTLLWHNSELETDAKKALYARVVNC